MVKWAILINFVAIPLKSIKEVCPKSVTVIKGFFNLSAALQPVARGGFQENVVKNGESCVLSG